MRFLKHILIIIFLFSKQLAFNQDCNRIDTLPLFELTSLKKELKKGKILSVVVDTIKSESIYDEFAWRIVETFDTKNQQIELSLLLDQSYFCYDWCIKERNAYAIELSRYDSIFVEGIYTNMIDTLDKSIIEFIHNPDNKPYLPEKRDFIIPYFDTIQVTKHGFYLMSVMIADSNGLCSTWDNLYPLINKILKCYLDLRNELSKEKWGIDFKNLDFDKKVAITKIYPIKIWLFPNRERVKPPPPPPYEMTNEYILDTLSRYFLEQDLKKVIEKEY